MTEEIIDVGLIKELRACPAITPQAVANDLSKVNKIISVDPEMGVVRVRRALDLILRNVASTCGIIPGTKPLEQLLIELNKVGAIPIVAKTKEKGSGLETKEKGSGLAL